MCGWGEEEPLKDATSSFVHQRGSLLRRFRSCVPLSEAAIHHLMQLPNLRSLIFAQGPPRTIPPSIFTSLERLRLHELAALPWLHLLASHKEFILQNGSAPATSHVNIRKTLRYISCPLDTTIDSTFLSSILKFRNLVALRLGTYFYRVGGCAFHLTDDNMEKLAASLHRLKSLQLKQPCGSNSRNTTVASLISISIHCPDLTDLETHFNTLTIVGDIQRLIDGGYGRNSAKCELRRLVVGYIPLKVHGEDIETIVVGFKVIFPCLTDFTDFNGHWRELGSKLRD